MVTFKPLEATLKNKGITTYQLIKKGVITYADLIRIKAHHNYTLKFINKLCAELKCDVSDIIQFEEDNN